MKWLLRSAFVGLALLVLVAQIGRLAANAPHAETWSIDPMLAELKLQPTTASFPGTFAATAVGCDEPILFAGIGFSGLGRDAARVLLRRPATPRFVYLGFVGEHPSTPAILARWAIASSLHSVGLRLKPVPDEVAIVMLPLACPSLAKLDWSRLSPWS